MDTGKLLETEDDPVPGIRDRNDKAAQREALKFRRPAYMNYEMISTSDYVIVWHALAVAKSGSHMNK